jgi:hypothetical protein
MTPPESISAWLVNWSLLTIISDVLPPREPNDDESAVKNPISDGFELGG